LDKNAPVLTCKPFAVVTDVFELDALVNLVNFNDDVTPVSQLWSSAFVSNEKGEQLSDLTSVRLSHGFNNVLVMVKDASDNFAYCKLKIVQVNSSDLRVKCKSVKPELKNTKDMFSSLLPSGIKLKEVNQTVFVSQGSDITKVATPDKVKGGKMEILSVVVDANNKLAACVYQTSIIDINTTKE
jgi:hypothetical protein